MSNTNTDQRLTAAQMTPITGPTAATITYVQASTTNLSSNVGKAYLPIPGQYKAKNQRVRVRLNYSVFGATVGSQALTVSIYAINNAATPAAAILATTGAINCATLGGVGTQYLNFDVEWVEPAVGGAATAVVRGGFFEGTTVGTGIAPAVITRTILSNQPVFTATNITGVGATEGLDEAQYLYIGITLAQTDATFVFTPLDFSLEVL
jgi:hypothetical protein